MDEVNLVAEALVSVQDALRDLAKTQFAAGSNRETLALTDLAISIIEISASDEEGNHSWFVDRVRRKT